MLKEKGKLNAGRFKKHSKYLSGWLAWSKRIMLTFVYKLIGKPLHINICMYPYMKAFVWPQQPKNHKGFSCDDEDTKGKLEKR